ncbi:MAG: hypothetical protein KY455_02760 [Euryarchaeota archaeon]|nr:hypothetical protein [Euryarchaeota archaeon]
MLRKSIVVVLAALATLTGFAAPAVASDDCEFTEDYIGGHNFVFTCDDGWLNPYVVVDQLGETMPCVDVRIEDLFTLHVKIPTTCIREDGGIAVATIGTVSVSNS